MEQKYYCIIVDDEPRICNLIQKIGAWDELNIEVATVCYDGETAVEKICTLKPDIVISDIVLPVYDGIQIIDKVKEQGVDSLFIIISGYDHFEYAQKAIQRGALDYLLKPIDKDVLNNVLKRACNLRAESREQKANIEEVQKANQDIFWRRLLNDEIQGMDEELFNRDYGFDFKPHSISYMMLIQITRSDLLDKKSLFINRLSEQFKKSFENKFFAFWVCPSGVFLLVNDIEETELQSNLQKIFWGMKSWESFLGNYTVTVGYSTPIKTGDNFSAILTMVQDACFQRFSDGGDNIFSTKDIPQKLHTINEVIDETFINQLTNAFSILDRGRVSTLLNDFLKIIEAGNDWDVNDIITYCNNLLFYLENACHIGHKKLSGDFVNAACYCVSYEDLLLELKKRVFLLMDEEEEHKIEESSKPVNAVKKYIADNYAKELYLEKLAKYVCLSPSYLSTIFKKQTGEGIADYINSVRCETAKKLLKNSNISVEEVAREVGYKDEKYFSRQFKKVVGISPTQYRRLQY